MNVPASPSSSPPPEPAPQPPLPLPAVLSYRTPPTHAAPTAGDMVRGLGAAILSVGCLAAAGLVLWAMIRASRFQSEVRLAFGLLCAFLLVDACLAFFAARRYLSGRHRGLVEAQQRNGDEAASPEEE